MSGNGDRDGADPIDPDLVDAVVRVDDREETNDDGERQCPRCGGDLSEYALFGRETVACDDCGYLDADADHTAPSVERESWDSALERFRERYGSE